MPAGKIPTPPSALGKPLNQALGSPVTTFVVRRGLQVPPTQLARTLTRGAQQDHWWQWRDVS
eukprot:4981533-Amphidinium_carterae.1